MSTDYLSTLNMPMKDNILRTIHRHIQGMKDAHSKVFVMRLDVRAKDNNEFSRFNQRLIQKEKRAGIDAQYVAVAEKNSHGEKHYHEVLLLDGSKTQSIVKHVQSATRIMNQLRGLPEDYNNGLIDNCNDSTNPQPNGIMLRRGNSDLTDLHNAYRQASYLAKEAQKDGFEKNERKVFASKMRNRKK